MLSVGRDKVETARTKIGFRKSTQVQIDDEGALPSDFVTTTVTTKPDKTAIKKAIQAGQAVAGAVLVENQMCIRDRSWCSSSRSNDHRAITIEVASDTKHPYKVTDQALAALIDLLVDICRRNGIKALLWKGDKSLIGQVDKQNMTVHRWFCLLYTSRRV